MSGQRIVNTDQEVDQTVYGKNFEAIFGEPKTGVTGTYQVNPETGELFKISETASTLVKDFQYKTEKVRELPPMYLKGKEKC